jgi:3-oxoacyl-[acyl-carrier protein] reductase
MRAGCSSPPMPGCGSPWPERHTPRAGADRLAEELAGPAMVARHELDDPGAAAALVEARLGWTGRIDVLVNNAVHWGPTGSADGPFEAVPDPDWLRVLRANTEGALRLSRAVAPVMRERRWGRMVHISSSLATDGAAGAEYYAAAKAALHGFSRSAAFSLGSDGDILSNVVMASLTRTDTNTEITEAAGHLYSERAALGRLLDAAEVAGPIVWLASAANTGITGQVIAVTGGLNRQGSNPRPMTASPRSEVRDDHLGQRASRRTQGQRHRRSSGGCTTVWRWRSPGGASGTVARQVPREHSMATGPRDLQVCPGTGADGSGRGFNSGRPGRIETGRDQHAGI